MPSIQLPSIGDAIRPSLNTSRGTVIQIRLETNADTSPGSDEIIEPLKEQAGGILFRPDLASQFLKVKARAPRLPRHQPRHAVIRRG